MKKNNLKRRILLVLGGCLISFAAAAVGQTLDDCAHCHPDFKHKQVKLTAKDKCLTCHGSLEAHDKKKASAGDQARITALRDELKAALKYEEFYSPSRLGDAPNEMIRIPAGQFIKGTNDRLPDEGPQHLAEVRQDYLIDKFEVTNAQYKRFIDETKHRSPKHFQNRTYPEGKADHPVVFVSWDDAKDYCTWAGKRLPSQEEWEKAARGEDGRTYPWGNDFDLKNANTPQRWAALDQPGDTLPVGSFEAGRSVYGLYDVSGNVWEWTDSWYDAYPGNTHITENYGEKYKVLKGGSWWDCSFYSCGISAPTFNRSFFTRSTKNNSFGFRCAKDA